MVQYLAVPIVARQVNAYASLLMSKLLINMINTYMSLLYSIATTIYTVSILNTLERMR